MSQPPTDPAEPSSQPAVPGAQPAVPGQPTAEDAGYDRYAQGAAVPPPQGGAVPPPQDEPSVAGPALPSPATSSPPGPALAAGDKDAPAPPGPAGYGPAPSDYPPAEPFGGAGSAPPSSGPPAEQPTVALPMSAAPMSGPPTAGVPTAGPPMFGVPYGAGAASARPGRTVLILAVVAGLLFITGAVMTGLFLNTAGDLNRAEKQLSQRDATIAANTEELDEVKVDLLRTQDALANAQQDLTGTQNDRDEQARQKEVIATCLDRLTTALAAAAIGDRKAHEKASEDLEEVCEEAEEYL
ncbi:hypothetical protein [Salinispora arenicola]|uniref:Uncharacterized protein n=1 Tax=Salinispora arenicola TaxID=168697 RepID=A0A542XUV5_SALAC|nr:hypothetical protein [Salinispora arenicola]TQL39614.1 hypothetical protein FB564_4881 [Salinispora arenicola]GIM81431.1 hypothetical protein Sar04_02130 [Salinispora arenicola]